MSTVLPAKRDHVRFLLIDLQVAFREAIMDLPYDTKRRIYLVDSLDGRFHKTMTALETALGFPAFGHKR